MLVYGAWCGARAPLLTPYQISPGTNNIGDAQAMANWLKCMCKVHILTQFHSHHRSRRLLIHTASHKHLLILYTIFCFENTLSSKVDVRQLYVFGSRVSILPHVVHALHGSTGKKYACNLRQPLLSSWL